jgi:ribose-phosphate pyrophosphokinase
MTHLAMISADSSSVLVPDVVYAFGDGWNQADALARMYGAALGKIDVHRFPDGETLVEAAPLLRAKGGVVAIYRSLDDPNSKLAELMLAANAVRSLGAVKVILIAPYLPYMRQDRAFAPGQAVSQAVLGQFLSAHFDTIVTIEPHLHRTHSLQSVFGETPAITIGAGRAIAAHMRETATVPTIVVGPDEESESLVREVVDVLGVSWFTARKVRSGDTEVHIVLPADLDIAEHPVVIVDDIVSSGTTVIALARALKAAGARAITAYAVHALFDQRAAFLMRRAGVSKIFSTSTVPHQTNTISTAEMICTALGVRT